MRLPAFCRPHRLAATVGSVLLTLALVPTASAAPSDGDRVAVDAGAPGRIVFERNSDPWVMDAATGRAARLARAGAGVSDYTYSPNGRLIAFETDTGIWVMNADGTRVRPVTKHVNTCTGAENNPAWSPNGKKLAFRCYLVRANQFQIYTINLDRTGLTRVTTGRTVPEEPTWSPDGRTIAYVNEGGALYTVPSGGGRSVLLSEAGPAPVSTGYWNEPDWAKTPAGSLIVAESSPYGIYLVNPTTGAVSAEIGRTPDDYRGFEPTFSPDGTRIAYTANRSLWSMGHDGSDLVQLTIAAAGDPSWGPIPR